MSTINYFYPFRFAGVDLEAASWNEDVGRTLVEHRPSRGDGAELSDRGRVPRTYALSIRVTGTPEQVAEKRASLQALSDSGDTRTFEHPIDGVLRCKMSDLQHKVGAGDVSFEMTLVEDLAFTRRFQVDDQPDLGTFPEVEIRAEEVSEALGSLGLALESTPPDVEAATARAASWPDRAQDDVTQDVQAFRSEVRPLVRELDRSSDVDAYQCAVALEAFRAVYEQYARAVTRQRGSTFSLEVARPQPLIVLLSGIYGARRAETIAEEVARINDVRDASRLASGTRLTLPVRSA